MVVVKESVATFGTFAGILAIITSAIVFLTLQINTSYLLFIGTTPQALLFLKAVALSWMLFSIPYFLGVLYFERNQKKRAAMLFFIFGILGLFFAVGFFAAAALAIWTGHIAIKDYWRDVHFKRLGVPVHHEITQEHIAALKARAKRENVKAKVLKKRRRRK